MTIIDYRLFRKKIDFVKNSNISNELFKFKKKQNIKRNKNENCSFH